MEVSTVHSMTGMSECISTMERQVQQLRPHPQLKRQDVFVVYKNSSIT